MKVAQSCPTLCDPMDYGPSASPVHGILQAIILKWVAYLVDLPNPGVKPGSSALQADSLPAELPGKPLYRVIAVYPCGFLDVETIPPSS